jgi:small subunit ribosomal protein S8
VIEIDLRYGPLGEKIILALQRVSRPGRRQYTRVDGLGRVRDGLGIAIVSTNRGVLSDRQCRQQRVGGEVLCTVW